MSGKVVTNKEYKPLSEYRKDILNQKFEKRNLDVVKGRFKNKNFTKSLNSLGNDITRAERDKKGQTREDNFSAANNIITDLTTNINPTLNQLTGMPKNEPTGHNIYNKNNGENPNIYYQSSYAPKTIQKAQEVKKLFKK